MDELEAAGAFDDNLQLGAGEDDIDRQLHQLTSQSPVDDELDEMKAELGRAAAAAGAGVGRPAVRAAAGEGAPA